MPFDIKSIETDPPKTLGQEKSAIEQSEALKWNEHPKYPDYLAWLRVGVAEEQMIVAAREARHPPYADKLMQKTREWRMGLYNKSVKQFLKEVREWGD